RMGGSIIQIVIQFLDIFSMVPLRAGQSKQPFFQNWITTIPQGQGKTYPAFVVGNTRYAILAPAINPASGMVMRKIVPSTPVFTIILPHCAPLPFTEVGAPF